MTYATTDAIIAAVERYQSAYKAWELSTQVNKWPKAHELSAAAYALRALNLPPAEGTMDKNTALALDGKYEAGRKAGWNAALRKRHES